MIRRYIHIDKIQKNRLERDLYVKLKDWLSNSVDPDETAHHEPSHLDICCLIKPVIIHKNKILWVIRRHLHIDKIHKKMKFISVINLFWKWRQTANPFIILPIQHCKVQQPPCHKNYFYNNLSHGSYGGGDGGLHCMSVTVSYVPTENSY